MNYRHAYHAGNHADVLKHIAMVALLRMLTRKDKPVLVVDTHAGAGRYALDSAGFDWVGCGDHDNNNGREYPWWFTQKTA